MNSKSLVNCFVWSRLYFEKKKRLECSWEFYHRFMFIAPSSDYQLLTLNQPFKVILRKFEVVFWCSRVRMMYFFKRLMNIHSNQPILYYGFRLSSILPLKRPLTHYWTSPLKSPFFPAPSFHARSTHCHCHSLSLSCSVHPFFHSYSVSIFSLASSKT